uniref:uncharacterized protein rp1l1a n=1 Tax=Centroberyx gerrardi TaxID=166262 RepID=UPI003AAC6E2B
MYSAQVGLWDPQPPFKYDSPLPPPPPPTSRLVHVTTAAPAKRITFYKSGDSQFGGVRMAIHKRSFKCFDALLDDLSQKVPLPFGVRNVTTPRGTHSIKHLEQLQDGGCYLCSDRRHAKPINMELAGKRPAVWHHHTRRPQPPEASSAAPPGHLPYRQRRILLVKNSEPGLRRSVVLSRRSTRSLRAFLDEISEVMQFHVRKLYTVEGRKIDSVQSLMTCPGVLVCVGREAFSPLLLDFIRKSSEEKLPGLGSRSPGLGPRTPGNGARSPATQGGRSPPHGARSRASEYSEGHESKKNLNFGLQTKKSIIHPRSDSSNPSTRFSLSSEKSYPNGLSTCSHSQGRAAIMNDDIEKRVLVNKDGSLSVEMRVRFRLQNDEALQWSTQIKKSPSLTNDCCPLSQAHPHYLQQGQSESCSDPDSASFDPEGADYANRPLQHALENRCPCCYQRQEQHYDLWENPAHCRKQPAVPPPHASRHSHTMVRHTHSSSSSSSCHSRRVVRCQARLSNCGGAPCSEQGQVVQEEMCVTEEVQHRVEVEQDGDTHVEVCKISRCCSRSGVTATDSNLRPHSRKSVEDDRSEGGASKCMRPHDELMMSEGEERPLSAVSSSSHVLQALQEDPDDEDDLPPSASQCCHSNEPSPLPTSQTHQTARPPSNVSAGSIHSTKRRKQTSQAEDGGEKGSRAVSAASSRHCGVATPHSMAGADEMDRATSSRSKTSQASRRSTKTRNPNLEEEGAADDENEEVEERVASGLSRHTGLSAGSGQSRASSACPHCGGGKRGTTLDSCASATPDHRAKESSSRASERSHHSHPATPKPASSLSNQDNANDGSEDERAPSGMSDGSDGSAESTRSNKSNLTQHGRFSAMSNVLEDRATSAMSRTSNQLKHSHSPTSAEEPLTEPAGEEEERAPSATSATSHRSSRSHVCNGSTGASAEIEERSPSAMSAKSNNSHKSTKASERAVSPRSEIAEDSTAAERPPERAASVLSVRSARSNVSAKSSKSHKSNCSDTGDVERAASALSAKSDTSVKTSASVKSDKSHKSSCHSSTGVASPADNTAEEEVDTNKRASSALSVTSNASAKSGKPDSILSATSAKSNVSAKSNTSHKSTCSQCARAVSPGPPVIVTSGSDEDQKEEEKETEERAASAMSAKSNVSAKSNKSHKYTKALERSLSPRSEAAEDGERAASAMPVKSAKSNMSVKSAKSCRSNCDGSVRAASSSSKVVEEAVEMEKEKEGEQTQERPATDVVAMKTSEGVDEEGEEATEERAASAMSIAVIETVDADLKSEEEKVASEGETSVLSTTSKKSKRGSGGNERPLSRASSGSVSLGLPEDQEQETPDSDSGKSHVSYCNGRKSTLSPNPQPVDIPTIEIPGGDEEGGEVGGQTTQKAASAFSAKSKSSVKSSRSHKSASNGDVKAAAPKPASKPKQLEAIASPSKTRNDLKPRSVNSVSTARARSNASSHLDTPDNRTSSAMSSSSAKVRSKSPMSASPKPANPATVLEGDSANKELEKQVKGKEDIADEKVTSVCSKIPSCLRPESAASARTGSKLKASKEGKGEESHTVKSNAASDGGSVRSVKTSNSQKGATPKESSSPCPLHSSNPCTKVETSSESALSHSLSAADLLRETMAAARPPSRQSKGSAASHKTQSEKSGRCHRHRNQKQQAEELELTPACLPNASPSEVVSDWLRSIPANGCMLTLGDELNEGEEAQEKEAEEEPGEAVTKEEDNPEDEKGEEEETAEKAEVEEQEEEKEEQAEGEGAEEEEKSETAPPAAEGTSSHPTSLLLNSESLPKDCHSSVAVMKVLLSPALGRCHSLPEVSAVYGRRLSTSAKGLLDCLAQLQLIEPAVTPDLSQQKDGNQRYNEIMGILQSLWLTEPKDKEAKDARKDQVTPPRSSSGVDMSSGSGGSGKDNGNEGGETPPKPTAYVHEEEGAEGDAGEGEEGHAAEAQSNPELLEPSTEKAEVDGTCKGPSLAAEEPTQGKEIIPSLDSPKASETPSSSDKSSANDSSKSPTDNERETLEDSSSGTPPTVQRVPLTKKQSQDPDPVWVLHLLKKLEKQFMNHYTNAMAEFKVRWDLDDNAILDTMISELKDEVSRRIQSSIERELRKIQGRAGRVGRSPRPPQGGNLSRESTMTERRRRMLKVMKNQSVKTGDSLSDGEMTGDFSDQRSEDEYCPCDACVRKKMAARPLKMNPAAAEAPVMMEFDLLKILQLKKGPEPKPAAAPEPAEVKSDSDEEERNLEVVQEEEEEEETKEDIKADDVLEETIPEADMEAERKEEEGETAEGKAVEEEEEVIEEVATEEGNEEKEEDEGEAENDEGNEAQEEGETGSEEAEEEEALENGEGEEEEEAECKCQAAGDEEEKDEGEAGEDDTGNEGETGTGEEEEEINGETGGEGERETTGRESGDDEASGETEGGETEDAKSEANEEESTPAEESAAGNVSASAEAEDEDDGEDGSGEGDSHEDKKGGETEEREGEASEEGTASPQGREATPAVCVTEGEEADGEDSDTDSKRPSDTSMDETGREGGAETTGDEVVEDPVEEFKPEEEEEEEEDGEKNKGEESALPHQHTRTSVESQPGSMEAIDTASPPHLVTPIVVQETVPKMAVSTGEGVAGKCQRRGCSPARVKRRKPKESNVELGDLKL